MRTDEFLSRVSALSTADAERFEAVRGGLPLGETDENEIVVAHRELIPERYHHTCVTGASKTEFISRLLLTLTCLYEKAEAAFLLVSPDLSYGRFMKLNGADVTVPFINSQSDLDGVLKTIASLAKLREGKKRAPKLFVVVDGIEEFADADKRSTLECYRPFFEAVGTSGIELITGVDLTQTVFVGYPGVFVGVGNCLVTPSSGGEADVTYVNVDGSMSAPKSFRYPNLPTVAESIAFLNGILE